MSVRDRIARQEKIEINIEWTRYWNTFTDSLPDILKSPSQLLMLGVTSLNMALEFALFAVLSAQTAHVLSGNEKRYINLRHLLIKWVFLVGALQLSSYIKQYTSQEQLFSLLYNSLLLLFVYPSKFIKNLHLKYFSFSERKKYDDSEEDPSSYEMSLSTRMLVSLTLFCLNASRFMITFVPLGHRKRIEEAMKGVNMVIVEEKYFWKIYESAWNSPATQPAPDQNAPPTPKGTMKNSTLLTKGDSVKEGMKNSSVGKPSAPSILRAKVGEYIEIVLNSISGGGRRFTFYRNLQLIYNLETSELTLVSQEDNKSTDHILAEISVVDDSILQLICEGEDEPTYVKFKLKKEMDTFISSISLED